MGLVVLQTNTMATETTAAVIMQQQAALAAQQQQPSAPHEQEQESFPADGMAQQNAEPSVELELEPVSAESSPAFQRGREGELDLEPVSAESSPTGEEKAGLELEPISAESSPAGPMKAELESVSEESVSFNPETTAKPVATATSEAQESQNLSDSTPAGTKDTAVYENVDRDAAEGDIGVEAQSERKGDCERDPEHTDGSEEPDKVVSGQKATDTETDSSAVVESQGAKVSNKPNAGDCNTEQDVQKEGKDATEISLEMEKVSSDDGSAALERTQSEVEVKDNSGSANPDANKELGEKDSSSLDADNEAMRNLHEESQESNVIPEESGSRPEASEPEVVVSQPVVTYKAAPVMYSTKDQTEGAEGEIRVAANESSEQTPKEDQMQESQPEHFGGEPGEPRDQHEQPMEEESVPQEVPQSIQQVHSDPQTEERNRTQVQHYFCQHRSAKV